MAAQPTVRQHRGIWRILSGIDISNVQTLEKLGSGRGMEDRKHIRRVLPSMCHDHRPSWMLEIGYVIYFIRYNNVRISARVMGLYLGPCENLGSFGRRDLLAHFQKWKKGSIALLWLLVDRCIDFIKCGLSC